MSKELLGNVSGKKEVYGRWRKEPAAWEECQNFVRLCRAATREGKDPLESNLARYVKDNKESFLKDISSKRKTGEMWCCC